MTGVEALYDIARAQTEEQSRRRQHLNTIASGLLAFSGALVAATTILAKDAGGNSEALAVGVGVAFLLTAGCVFGVFKPRIWDIQPPLPLMLRHVMNGESGDEELIGWAVNQMSRAIANNEVILGQKAGWLTRAYLSIGAQVTLLGALVVFSV